MGWGWGVRKELSLLPSQSHMCVRQRKLLACIAHNDLQFVSIITYMKDRIQLYRDGLYAFRWLDNGEKGRVTTLRDR